MTIKTIPLGMIQANCYIISSNQKNACVIDPGGDAKQILRYLDQNGLSLSMILLTHGHHDHIAGVWELNKDWSVPVYVPEEDLEMLENIQLSLCGMAPLYFHYQKGVEYHTVKDGDLLILDELEISVLHTPGHSKGSSCYLIGDCLFTGDTLFCGGIGRCDLYGGNYQTIKKSLERIAAFPQNFNIYPGHGRASTLDLEKKTNPYLGQVSYDDYF